MAKVTSSVSGNTTTYVITDAANNTLTIAAAAPGSSGGGLTFTSSGALAVDGQQLLSTLINMLWTGLRPNVQINQNASFGN